MCQICIMNHGLYELSAEDFLAMELLDKLRVKLKLSCD